VRRAAQWRKHGHTIFMTLETWESTSEHRLMVELMGIVTDMERRLEADAVYEIEDVGMELEDDAYYQAYEVGDAFVDELATPVWTADVVEVVCAACRNAVVARRCR